MTQDEVSTPYGFCQCGCGDLAPVSPFNNAAQGYVKGEPRKFIRYHAARVMTPEHRENMSKAQAKRMEDPARRAAVSTVHTGKTISAEHKAALSAAHSREHNHQWAGGRTPHGAGYVYVMVGRDHPMANPKGYALEHRIVMAHHVGRMLTTEEVVHHKTKGEGGSGRKDDNRIENLLLLPSHVAHVAHHTALRRAARLAST